jgi:hypothetical protein
MNFFVVFCTQIIYFVYVMENKELTTVTIRMEPELRDRLASLADSEKRALSNYLRVVLQKHADVSLSERAEGQSS